MTTAALDACPDCGYRSWPCPSCGVPICNCAKAELPTDLPKAQDDFRPLRWRKHHYTKET